MLFYSILFFACGNNEENVAFKQRTERVEGSEPGDCSDGADNDTDGLWDCNDDSCSGAPECNETDEPSTEPSSETSTEPSEEAQDERNEEPEGFYLDSNGITVKCTNASIGDTGVINGVTYTKRSEEKLRIFIELTR